jgi:hypothetical protein
MVVVADIDARPAVTLDLAGLLSLGPGQMKPIKDLHGRNIQRT